jgi:hypothetical protein
VIRSLLEALLAVPLRMTSLTLRGFAGALAPRGAAGPAPGEPVAGDLTRLVLAAAGRSADVLRLLLPGRAGAFAWQEFKDKWECFELFEWAPRALRAPAGAGAPLAELASRAWALGEYRGLWATEGLGYDHAERALRGGPPCGLLAGGNGRGLPPGSLPALHAGMGLAFAVRLLGALPRGDRAADLRTALREFVRLCRDNAAEGHAEAALEGLGLATRNLFPHLVRPVDRQLADVDPDLVAYFWHGVGRALYFAPTNFIPCACWAWPGLDKARHEAPHRTGRLNAVAGLGWALALVNIRRPEVIESFIERHGGRLAEDGAFANGVSSAALVWRHWAGPEEYLDGLLRHAPDPSRPGLGELWRRLVADPCREALEGEYPVLAWENRLGTIFRYRERPGSPGRW